MNSSKLKIKWHGYELNKQKITVNDQIDDYFIKHIHMAADFIRGLKLENAYEDAFTAPVS